MKKNVVIWISIFLLLIVGFYFFYQRMSIDRNQTNKSNLLIFTVKKGDIESTVSSVGSILSTDSRELSVSSGSTVQKILCSENQSVKKGDVLFILTNENANIELERANLILAQRQTQAISLQNQQKELTIRSTVEGIVRSINTSLNDSVSPPYGMSVSSPLIQMEDISIMKFTLYPNASETGENMKGIMPSSQKINIMFKGVGIKECIVSSVNTSQQGASVTFQVLEKSGLTFGTFYNISIPVMMGMEIPISSPVQISGNTVLLFAKQNGIVKDIKVKIGDKVIPNQELIITTNDTLTNQIQMATLDIKSAQLDVKNKKKVVEDLIVKAPIDGVVFNIQVKEGSSIGPSPSQNQSSSSSNSMPKNLSDLIKGNNTISESSLGGSSVLNTGVTIAIIENQTSRKVSITIDELDIARIKVGQKANITLDAFVNRVFTGTITSISARGIIQNGYSTFQADIRIDGSEKLLTGMSATVNIISDSKKEVLLLPLDVILSKKERRFVLIQTPEGIQEKDITVGIVNEDYAEIVEGLKEGDQVVLPLQDSNFFNRINNSADGPPRFPMMPGSNSHSTFSDQP